MAIFVLSLNVYALEPIEVSDINKVIKSQEIVISKIIILPSKKNIIVELAKNKIDDKGNIVSTVRERRMVFKDSEYDEVIKNIKLDFSAFVNEVKAKYKKLGEK